MQVILLQRVVNLGKFGETVDVKAGYGRNYLIPQGAKHCLQLKPIWLSLKLAVLNLKL